MTTLTELQNFAARYAAAWCSQDPEQVAAFFAANGSLSINDAAPALGRVEISREAKSFMTTFPDLVVTFDKLERRGENVEFHWTLNGTDSSPNRSKNKVRISGSELWRIDDDGLIAESKGTFDSADYERQLGETR